MSEKTFNLIKGVATGCEAIAVAVVAYCCEPATAAAVNGSIVIAVQAGLEICKKFVKE